MTAADMEPSWNRVGRNDTASIHEAADKHCEVCLPPHRVLRHGVMICRCNVGILPLKNANMRFIGANICRLQHPLVCLTHQTVVVGMYGMYESTENTEHIIKTN